MTSFTHLPPALAPIFRPVASIRSAQSPLSAMGSAINLSDIGTLLSRDDAQFQQESVADLLNATSRRFPGAQPVSFCKEHFEELLREDYFMCEKTDGIRCLLYLTKFVDEVGRDVEMQFLIDRKNDYYFVPTDAVHIPCVPDPRNRESVAQGFELAGFHTGTLVDGELVRQRSRDGGTRLAYLMFDILALDHQQIMDRPFDKRMARLEAFVWKPYRKFAEKYREDADAQPFQLAMKGMDFPYATQQMFREKIPKLPHGNDGLIFTCVSTPYRMGTDDHILKWKPPHENTIDFRLQIAAFPTLEDSEGEYEDYDAIPTIELLIYLGHNNPEGPYRRHAYLHLTSSEWEAMKRMNQAFDHRIIECWREPTTGHWRPKIEEDGTPRFRDDKDEANHVSTVNSVIRSIEDAVSEEDLMRAAEGIRARYKERLRRREEEAKRAEEEERRRRAVAQQQQQQKREEEVDDGPRYED